MNKKTTIQFLIRTDENYHDEATVSSHYTFFHPETIAILKPEDIDRFLKGELTQLTSSGKTFENICILNETNEILDATSILESVEPFLGSNCEIEIFGCKVDERLFLHLIRTYSEVFLNRCDVAFDNVRASYQHAKCRSLNFSECTTSITETLKETLHWPALTSLFVGEGFWNDGLHSPTSIKPAFSPSASKLTAEHCKVFLGPSLTQLSFDRCESIEFLALEASIEGLSILSLNLCSSTSAVFAWVTQHSELVSLCLNWLPGTILPWQRLVSLKALRRLEVDCTNLTDEDVSAILEACRYLRVLDIHYSSVTPKIWPELLAKKSLRSLTISSEMLKTEPPENLPEQTKLREILVINSRPGYLPQIAQKYPSLEIFKI